MPEQQARLRIHGKGNIEVELATAYLNDLGVVYNSFVFIETFLLAEPIRSLDTVGGFSLPTRRYGRRLTWNWPPNASDIASYLLSEEKLVLLSVQINSPGFWEFLGTLNPLEVTRQWLNDRHERRKDREYRERAERRKLDVENFVRETEAIARRIKVAREAGISDTQLEPLFKSLIYDPLLRLETYQDKGVIEHAELLPAPPKPG